MNYIELELGGKKRGAKLGLGFLRTVTESKKITIEELFKSIEGSTAVFFITELIYHSFAYNCKRKGQDVDFDLDDVFDWIDESGGVSSEAYKKFLEALFASIGVDLGKEVPQKRVAKKAEEK